MKISNDVIRRAIESAKCRIYRVKADKFCSEQYQKKAYRQEEIQRATIKALELQLAKKPETNGIGVYCPRCEELLYNKPYCPKCGQKIDWG